MKSYEIWMSGYLCTGMDGIPEPARLIAKVKANTFKKACIKYYAEHDPNNEYFNKENLTYWDCKLYSNPEQARASFG